MRPIDPDALVRALALEFQGEPGRAVARRDGLVFKRAREPGKARQEFEATRLARLLLPASLEVPRSWGVVGDQLYVSEELPEKCSWRDPRHVDSATDYLAELHRVEPGAELRGALIAAGFHHYHGETLRRRLAQELEHARRAFAAGRFAAELDVVSELVRAALDRWSFEEDAVLGHGDFQRSNLFVRSGKIVPIDWVDFGLCDRAYDLAHLLRSLPEERRARALARYVRATGVDPEALRLRGQIVDSIVRAGAEARQAQGPDQDFEERARRFSLAVRAGLEALTS